MRIVIYHSEELNELRTGLPAPRRRNVYIDLAAFLKPLRRDYFCCSASVHDSGATCTCRNKSSAQLHRVCFRLSLAMDSSAPLSEERSARVESSSDVGDCDPLLPFLQMELKKGTGSLDLYGSSARDGGSVPGIRFYFSHLSIFPKAFNLTSAYSLRQRPTRTNDSSYSDGRPRVYAWHDEKSPAAFGRSKQSLSAVSPRVGPFRIKRSVYGQSRLKR